MQSARSSGLRPRLVVRQMAVAVLAGGVLLASACGPSREVKQVSPAPLREVPDVFRGTIGAEAAINGTEPQLISGLGVVVGLNGTGGGEIRPDVMTTMERELARNGIGRGGPAIGELQGVSPQAFLRSKNVAVVIVEARIPPGAPEGSVFDVSVRTLPGSTVTSLEGGTLWTTEMRLGPATTFGGYKTRQIAEARGPIYVNPFTEPTAGGPSEIAITRTYGRILGGGRVTDPLKLELVLDSDSHARARSVVAAVNANFPRGAGELGQTARGRGSDSTRRPGTEDEIVKSQSIAIALPKSYKDDPAEFLQLLRYTRIDQAFPQEFARRYVEELKSNPAMSDQLAWCLKAVGKTAVPFLVPMYDYPEYAPRMAALDAGAFHGDPRVVPHLVELAKSGPPALKTRAIRLLSRMPANPSINLALREMVNAPELEVRVAAWEGLSKRNDLVVTRRPIGPDARQPRFVLETVPAADPLIYVTQQGEPKIVIFGGGQSSSGVGDLGLSRPMLVSAWSDRFMLKSDCPTCPVRVYYQNPRTGEVKQDKTPDNLARFVEYLAHKSTPEEPAAGLDMSYSEVVGLLYEMSRQGGVTALFATEQDRLRAEIFEAAQATVLTDRPETTEGERAEEVTVFKPTQPAAPAGDTGERLTPGFDKPRIIPLIQPQAAPAPSASQ